jgi:CHAT domain-containing protein
LRPDTEARFESILADYELECQTRSDPAKALRDIQLSYLKDDRLHDPRIWAPYILVE